MAAVRPGPDAARRSEPARRAVLEAAFELVGEVGYPRLSIEGIARRAGVGKQTIYRWWPSKGAVLLDAVLALAQGGEGQTAALPDTGDVEADLKRVLRATAQELSDPRIEGPLRALSVEIELDPELAALYAERLDTPMKDLKRERLKSAQRTGELAQDLDLDLAIELLWGPIQNRWLMRSGPLTPGYANELVELALAGLRA